MEKFQLGFKTKKYVINLAQACDAKKVWVIRECWFKILRFRSRMLYLMKYK